MYEVNVNGFKWFADTQAKILYEDKEKTKGTPFSFLTKNELEQVEREIRSPRPKTTED